MGAASLLKPGIAPVPPITNALILLNVLVYALEVVGDPETVLGFALWPPGSGGAFHVWQVVSYSVLHASLVHLGLNMFALWMFGTALERHLDALSFLLTYLSSVVFAALTQIVVSGLFLHDTGPVIGASGGVFGLLLAYAMCFPERAISVVFLPFLRIPARAFVFGYGAVELVLGFANPGGSIAHFAHLGGLIGGWLAVRYFRPRGGFNVR